MPPIPYCGTPPIPGGVSWNLDPALILVLVLGALATLWLSRPPTQRHDPRPGPMSLRNGLAGPGPVLLGWILLALTLVSPLCNLSVALFSARVGQHMILTLLAAPLVALAFPRGTATQPMGLLGPTTGFAVALWGWHLPAPYVATFASEAAYWTMQISLTGCAVWLWAALRARTADRPDVAALAALATAVQMGLLGALLTIAPRPLFVAVHTPGVTMPWGLSPLEDQQLGGLLMWVPGGLVFAAVCLAGMGRVLKTVAQADSDAASGSRVQAPQ